MNNNENSDKRPLVSIIMNCYNGEKYLREAIDSIYEQTYTNWEIIFWDNNSIDNSADIAKAYDNKLRYFKGNHTIPLGGARNKALKKASGEWVGFLDTDDYWLPEKLSSQINAIRGTDYVLCYAGIHDIEPSGKLIRKYLPHYKSGYMFSDQLVQFDINMVTPIVNKKIMDKYSIYFEEQLTASEEYNLFLRLLAKGEACTINRVLGAWRISDGTTTDQQINNWYKERFFTLEQLKKENPGIEQLFPEAFQEAFARGVYYKARYLMNAKKFKEARKELKRISYQNKKYFFLFLASLFPALWKLLHKQNIKRKLSPKLLGY